MRPPGIELAALQAFAILAEGDAAAAAKVADVSGVEPGSFADSKLGAIWGALELAVRDGRTPDLFAIEAVLPKDIGRPLLVDVLMSSGFGDAAQRLAVVRAEAQRRRLATGLDAARRLVDDRARPLTEAIAEAQKVLEAAQQQAGGVRALDVDVLQLVDHLEEVAAGRRAPVLETGLEKLDAIIGGLQPTLIAIGALPGVGKSALLAAIVRNLAARGEVSGVLSLEDEGQWLVRRLVAESARVPVFVLANRPLGKNQRERVGTAVEWMHGQLGRVLVEDRPCLGTADVLMSCRTMLARGAKALFVDHLGEIRLERSDRHDLDVAEVLQQLRGLSKSYRVPLVVFSHLRRRQGLEQPDDEPKLTDFAFSAAIERMARVALGLSRPNTETLRVHVLKQTQGAAGLSVDLDFDGPAGVVRSASGEAVRAQAAALYEEETTP